MADMDELTAKMVKANRCAWCGVPLESAAKPYPRQCYECKRNGGVKSTVPSVARK